MKWNESFLCWCFFSFDLSVFLSQNRYVYISPSFWLRTSSNESGARLKANTEANKLPQDISKIKYLYNLSFSQSVVSVFHVSVPQKLNFISNKTLLISNDFEWFRCRSMNINNGMSSSSYQCKTDLSISFKCQNIEECWGMLAFYNNSWAVKLWFAWYSFVHWKECGMEMCIFQYWKLCNPSYDTQKVANLNRNHFLPEQILSDFNVFWINQTWLIVITRWKLISSNKFLGIINLNRQPMLVNFIHSMILHIISTWATKCQHFICL